MVTSSIESAFDRLDPKLVLSFTIDRYVMDVLERVARTRGITFLEMTASIIPDQVIFHQRGRLVPLRDASRAELDEAVDILCTGSFSPAFRTSSVSR